MSQTLLAHAGTRVCTNVCMCTPPCATGAVTACRGHGRALALLMPPRRQRSSPSRWQERAGGRNNSGGSSEQELLPGCTARSRENDTIGSMFLFPGSAQPKCVSSALTSCYKSPRPEQRSKAVSLVCSQPGSPVREQQGRRKLLWHGQRAPLWIQGCTRRLQAGGTTRNQISVLAPTNALLLNRESEWELQPSRKFTQKRSWRLLSLGTGLLPTGSPLQLLMSHQGESSCSQDCLGPGFGLRRNEQNSWAGYGIRWYRGQLFRENTLVSDAFVTLGGDFLLNPSPKLLAEDFLSCCRLP